MKIFVFFIKILACEAASSAKAKQEVKAMAYDTTGEIAKAAKVTVRTIQYYDRQG
ncbi:MAG: hypothetical protein PUF83_08660 [Intestinibaculum porci]|uniref:MerR family DNA-binding transcriptional regulator n=1 Tax=Intestinibaculum porci TaxID=2487118 RepID=UPI0024095258|nr:MerR family DNA-binding transcriptional regulator [Intestinibaculum porci]MDD6423114.1 hypothetical protein [Intestinibaculum porci]